MVADHQDDPDVLRAEVQELFRRPGRRARELRGLLLRQIERLER